jgi:hypothetical protein
MWVCLPKSARRFFGIIFWKSRELDATTVPRSSSRPIRATDTGEKIAETRSTLEDPMDSWLTRASLVEARWKPAAALRQAQGEVAIASAAGRYEPRLPVAEMEQGNPAVARTARNPA